MPEAGCGTLPSVGDAVAGLCGFAFMTPALLCWFLVARVPAVRWAVAEILVLIALAVAGLTAGWIQTRARLELIVAAVPVAALVIGVGLLLQWRRPPDGPSLPGVRTGAGAAFLGAFGGFVAFCCVPGLDGDGPFRPSDREFLPLPAGLVVVEDKDFGCGVGVCVRRFTVGSTDGASGAEIAAAVRWHLAERHGWADGDGCRPHGWLLDRSQLCVSVGTGADRVVVLLEGARATPSTLEP